MLVDAERVIAPVIHSREIARVSGFHVRHHPAGGGQRKELYDMIPYLAGFG
jgi:hypothetical protein